MPKSARDVAVMTKIMRMWRSRMSVNLPLLMRAVAVVAAAVAIGSVGLAVAADPPEVEDILFMVDGRELHGRIVSQSPTVIVLEVIDRKLHLTSRVTFARRDIARIERDVAIEVVVKTREPAARRRSTASRPDQDTLTQSRFGRVRPEDESLDLPGLYVIPMKGQLGTDIHPSIYEKVAQDIRAHEPDLLVFVMNCKDVDDLLIPQNEVTEQALFLLPECRKIVDLFRDELGDIPQVMWVEDSVGFSSLLAMAWERMYMTPTARLGGLRGVAKRADGWSDPDVAAKMMAAWTGIGRGFLENGGYHRYLADAMMRPEALLSASFEGRKVVWSLDDAGEFLVDGDSEKTLGFRAKPAEDLLISDGTVDNLDDLAFLLGYREYRKIAGKGEEIVTDYKDRWRRVYDNTKTLWDDYLQHRGWASGDETLRWLSKAKRDVQKIIRAMNRYEAVEIRWRTDRQTKKQELEILVETMNEEIQALTRQRRGGGYGSGGGRRFGGG